MGTSKTLLARREWRWRLPDTNKRGDGKPKSMAQGRKSHVLPLLLPVVAPFFASGPAAHAQTESSRLRGREVAQRACAGCHAMEGTQGGSIQGTEVPSFRAIAGRNWSAERLQAFIMTPHRVRQFSRQRTGGESLVAASKAVDLGGERPLPSIARFGRLVCPMRGEATNRDLLGCKRHSRPGIDFRCQRWGRPGWQANSEA